MLTPPHVVLVEDDDIDARLFKRALRSAAFKPRIEWVKDGQAAIDLLLDITGVQDNLPKLVVLDIKLPKLLGFDVLERLRGDDRTRKLPIVMFSSSNQPKDIVRAYDCGANSYLVKPSNFDQLKVLVDNLLTYWLTFNEVTLASATGDA